MRADPTRHVPSGDPRARELVESVGAALRDVGVALAAGGSAVGVRRPSRTEHRDPLAIMEEGVSPAGPAPVLVTAADDDQPASRQAREALQRLWLELTRLSLAAGPTAQPRQAPQTRDDIRIELVGGAVPQMLLWIGGTERTGDTPRRARAEVVTGSSRPPDAPPVHHIPRGTRPQGPGGERRPTRPVSDGRGGTTWIFDVRTS